MNDVGRPTSEELDRMDELVEEHFVGGTWALEIRCWDDGDVHLTAYSTLGTNCDDGYPLDAVWHRQIIEYERQDETCVYYNRTKIDGVRPDRILNRFEIAF